MLYHGFSVCPLFECPTDMEQRTGRILRQGNENPKVKIFRYVTDKSFDSFLYQILETKQKFISQVMTSKTPERTCADIDETALDYAEVKALCAGNSLIKREMDLQGQIRDIKMEKSRYSERIYDLQDNIRIKYPSQIEMLSKNLARSIQDKQITEQSKPVLKIDNKTFDMEDSEQKKTAGIALRTVLNDPKYTSAAMFKEVLIGEYKGLKLSMMFDDFSKVWKGNLQGEKPHYFELNILTDTGNTIRMDNCINNIGKEIESSQEKLEQLNSELAQMKIDVEKPFAKAEELRSLERELDEVHIALTKFTLTDDTPQKDLFERFVEVFPEFMTGDCTYQKYEADGYEQLSAEMNDDIFSMAHTYVQNGDLMWDPRIDFKIDYENKKAVPVSFENSGLGVYEKFDVGNPTPETMKRVNDLIEHTDQWLDTIESENYTPVNMEDREQKRGQDIAI